MLPAPPDERADEAEPGLILYIAKYYAVMKTKIIQSNRIENYSAMWDSKTLFMLSKYQLL